MASDKVNSIIDSMETLNVLELVELKKTMEEKLFLEDIKAEVDQLVSYFVWAEDFGPDGKVRRTMSDLFFAEVRPFEEIYRKGEGQDSQQQQQQQGQGQQQ